MATPLPGQPFATCINLGPFASSNINACSEPGLTFFGQCNFQNEETSWYSFIAPGNPGDMPKMDFRFTSYTGSGSPFMGLFSGACGSLSAVHTNCLSGVNTVLGNLGPLTPGQQYFIVISSIGDTGGNFEFTLRFNNFPEKDDPDTNSPRPPFVLSLGMSHSNSTCCASGFNDLNTSGLPLDLPNVQCSAATHDGAVWYQYTTGSEVGVEIMVTPSGSAPISGATTVEVLTGSATNPGNALFDPTSFSCGNLQARIKIGCYDTGEIMWIKVASQNQFCGSFTIAINLINQCPLADECDDITGAQTLGPTVTDPSCGSFSQISITGCLDVACPQTDVGDCAFDQNPTVWFQVTVDNIARQLGSTVSTSGTWTPRWAIYSGTCGNLTLVASGSSSMPAACSDSDSNPNTHSIGVVTDIFVYYIAVSGEGVIDDPNFTLNVWTSVNCVSCIPPGTDSNCTTTASFSITQRSSGRPLNDPFFCQGEMVTVCVNYFYDASATGSDWFHGLIPDFGPGWDLTAFNPNNVNVSPAGAQWAEHGSACAPIIRERMPLLCTFIDPLTGRYRLCNFVCEPCPCTPPMLPNDPLPSGWFWNRPGGAGCFSACTPSDNYGIGSTTANINFCVNLQVREFADENECNANKSLRFNFQTTSDGVSGCWNDPTAECKLDKKQIGPNWQIDCVRPPKVLGNDREICRNGNANIFMTNSAGSSAVTIVVTPVPNPFVSGANSHNFSNGSGTINDFLTNNSSSIQIQKYEAYCQIPGYLCGVEIDTFQIKLM
ncbi:MAG: hypothetical protein IPL55_07680 [Saprospiraceae bacterium]|nr:hypothetical protein [Saprospiraceae bacterium]